MRREPPSSFQQLQASELWCDRCKRAVPVRQRLLLILPGENLYEYLCSQCGRSLGRRKESDPGNLDINLWRGRQ